MMISRIALVGIMIVWLAGCQTMPQPRPGDERYRPAMPVITEVGTAAQGSIYAVGAGVSLWEDKRARRVGDIITLMLEERTVSSKSNSTSIDKEDSINMGVEQLLGVDPTLKILGKEGVGLGIQAGNNREFAGDAGSDQSNRLQGEISVTVVDVLANNNLVVRGEKWMTLSQGNEFIRIEGILRPADVAPDNTAESTRLADARITYSATGDLADAQVRGWASRFFNSPWWPF